jgi:hypothetical protein
VVNRKHNEHVPAWSDTPLNHWSKDIDPVIMAGDEWVDDGSDPGTEAFAQKMAGRPPAPFLHPMHDTSYEVDDDQFAFDDDTP